uniref:CRAL-TRIO domain-containing protein n=1 Tax=Polytomella parva TaxID=51329 RepID=A0A7S0VLS0_9CHLO|eukprot:CAMPEP_0175040240 /NCGR_PEP_ID=MMETSP0052_2-20121109/1139_1 /TAXON_ID=51329 ORGANISM="Polytomella parva, Strain SAG 63-3" /NCGR_SAMPLE_ID=MMETSP0052_2 /ASSEMBLY_ACC=CAM_ASM_000194 /LENGTH=330 /DNA_ID=CAMNT_0016302401 /DNA_START=44 /DNA_END=1036 /DNA_ORIENTATION=-
MNSSKDSFTPAQLELIQQLKQAVADQIQKSDDLTNFCNEHTYVRYMRARNWDLKKATAMLKTTLEWRLEYKPHLIKFEEVKIQATTGKLYIYPHADQFGRPIVLMRPRLENTKPSDNQIRYLIYCLEWASKLADDTGVGKMCWLLDFEGYSLRNAPPIRTSLHCNHILQNHYPERLGCAVCYHSPTLFSLTWKAVSPFIDPVTKGKIHFVSKGSKEKEEMNSRFQLDKMEVSFGGEVPDYLFNMEEYVVRTLAFEDEVKKSLDAVRLSIQLERSLTTTSGAEGASPPLLLECKSIDKEEQEAIDQAVAAAEAEEAQFVAEHSGELGVDKP